MSIICIGCLIGIYFFFPETQDEALKFVFATLIAFGSGVIVWPIIKITMGFIALHQCKRREKCRFCQWVCVDMQSKVIFNDITIR